MAKVQRIYRPETKPYVSIELSLAETKKLARVLGEQKGGTLGPVFEMWDELDNMLKEDTGGGY